MSLFPKVFPNDKQKEVDIHNIPDGWQGLDIGAKTRKVSLM